MQSRLKINWKISILDWLEEPNVMDCSILKLVMSSEFDVLCFRLPRHLVDGQV